MFEDEGRLTEEEQILISRYPAEIQERLKNDLLRSKEKPRSFIYDSRIDQMEQGLEINFSKNDIGNVTTEVGKLNTARLARLLLEIDDGISRQPTKQELEHDGRLEAFKQFPKGTRIMANGELRKGS
jgi:hypothetical protein